MLLKLVTTAVVCCVLVVILCGSEKFIRDFMLTAHRLHMTNGQYVYVVADQVPPQNVNRPWVAGDRQDDTAKLAFQSVLEVRIVQFTQSRWLTLMGKGKRGFVWRLVVIIPLRRSGMARVLKGSQSFTCTPRVHPLTE